MDKGAGYDKEWKRSTWTTEEGRIRIIYLAATRIFFGLVIKFRVDGLEHIPQDGACIISAAPHTSHLDTGAVTRALLKILRKKMDGVFFLGALDHFFEKGKWWGRYWRVAARVLLIERRKERRKEQLGSIRRAAQFLRQGIALVVYPEGGRAPSREWWTKLREFENGVGWLSSKTETPIIPCVIRGTSWLFPKAEKNTTPWLFLIPRIIWASVMRAIVLVEFAPPVYPDKVEPREGESREDAIMREVRARTEELLAVANET